MKQAKHSFCLLLLCCFFSSVQAQFVKSLHDTWYDDALVDLQYNSFYKKPEGLFKLGTGYNVLSFDEYTGNYVTSKFVILPGKTLTPKCMAEVGTKCFVFCEDATQVYWTSLNTSTGILDYTITLPRTNTNFYYDLSPVDAAFDGVNTLHAVFSAKNYQYPATLNLVHLSINITTGLPITGKIWGDGTWHVYPNDIEFVDNQHIYASGWRSYHAPIGHPRRQFILPLAPTYPSTVFDFVISGTQPGVAHLKYYGGKLYMVTDNFNSNYLSAGPLTVLRVTDNNNTTITVNSQHLYGSPGATFFIHDVQQDYQGNIVAAGRLPVFSSTAKSSPRNFTFETGSNTPTMNDYGPFLGGNVNIRTAYSTDSYQLFSVAKEDDMTLVMHDLHTKVHPTTTDCRVPLTLTSVLNTVTRYYNTIPERALSGFQPQTVVPVHSSKTYILQPECWESTPKAPAHHPVSPNQQLTLSPNPTEGALHLEHTEGITQIRLYDPSGRLLLQRVLPLGTPSTDLDLSSVAAGIYLLETETNTSRTHTKIIRK